MRFVMPCSSAMSRVPLTCIAALMLSAVSQASDIGGEVVPPVCVYAANGLAPSDYPAACNQAFGIANILGSPGDTANLTRNLTTEPWELTETLSGESLTLRFTGTFGPYYPIGGDPLRRGNPTESGHVLARWFAVSITNKTAHPWTQFRFELRSRLDSASDEEDTISFGEWLSASFLYGPPYSPDFSGVNAFDPDFEAESSDVLIFSGGSIAPDQVARFHFLISSNTVDDFYLIQQQGVPEPATGVLMGVGLVAVLLWKRRRA